MSSHDLCRVVGQREGDWHLSSLDIDKAFCNCLRGEVGDRSVDQLNVNCGIRGQRDALTIANRAGELGIVRLRVGERRTQDEERNSYGNG